MGALETADILRNEAKAIRNVDLSEKTGAELYRALNELNTTALCLSGGGIRSAAFCLGIIQALAAQPRPIGYDKEERVAGKVCEAGESLLSIFDYLSTVSGGGYIGSWLSAWRARSNFETVWTNLIERPSGSDIEPKPIHWLRSYSNYLTPRTGILSADLWAALALYIGNLIMNWLVILPFVCAAILVLKLVVWVLIWATLLEEFPFDLNNVLFALAGIFFLANQVAFSTRHRPSLQLERTDGSTVERGVTQKDFLRGSLLYSLVSAIALTQFLGSNFAGAHLVKHCSDADLAVEMCFFGGVDKITYLNEPIIPLMGGIEGGIVLVSIVVAGAAIGALVYALGWLWGSQRSTFLVDLKMWAASGLVYGGLVGLGFYLYLLIPDEESVPLKPIGWFMLNPTMYLVVGVSWILIAQVVAEIVFAGLIDSENKPSADWEWLARAGGWKLVVALGWAVAMLLTFPNFHESNLMQYLSWVIAIGGLSAFTVAILGLSRLSPGQGRAKGLVEKSVNGVLTIAGPLFAAAVVFSLSVALDKLIFGASGTELLINHFPSLETMHELKTWGWQILLVGLACVSSIAVGLFASQKININRFSLHAVYRDRLIRAFLGASRERKPDRFTDMDEDDNLKMHTLWSGNSISGWQPFHVINMTLNIVSAKLLAWQERKAAPFIVTPLHCGTGSAFRKDASGKLTGVPVGAYRCAREYGAAGGISVGTAMAISGAAASPNMGYHSSPSITFLMTMLNVRLGWWLGNPADDKTYMHDGPVNAIKPLVEEAFGLTTDESPYVYLSDGGHFENLGLYEMVRRRCRFIVVVDAGCDPTFTFQDLGNALRKIEIDLGISIRFDGLERLKRRPSNPGGVLHSCDYHAIGHIKYSSVNSGRDGVILYVKAGYHGTERIEVRSFAETFQDFPHQSTIDQSFGEMQFESYRALGLDIMNQVLSEGLLAESRSKEPAVQEFQSILRELKVSRRHGSQLSTVDMDQKPKAMNAGLGT